MKEKENHHYFKKYVHEHPKDKFAWYLLGKEYAEKGQLGKAAYCFAKSEEVFEAFETTDSPAMQQMRKVVKEARQSTQKKKRSWKRAGVAALLLLLLLVPTDVLDLTKDPDKRLAEQVAGQINDTSNVTFYYMNKFDQAGGTKDALEFMLGTSQERSVQRILLASERSQDYKWQFWFVPPRPILSVQNAVQSSQALIRYFDAATCNCTPDDPSSYRGSIIKWQRVQEEAIVLDSAIAAFERKFGKKPQVIEQLTASYPNNILSGVTPAMRQMFDAKQKAVQDKESAGQSGKVAIGGDLSKQSNNGETKSQQQAKSQHPLEKPLSIVIDKANYQLAIMSDEIILRTYSIGLGGERTPEGEFEISEKVRNPNGKSNGEFGSRGMTLSDTLYAIHGTNKPESVGKDESLGCIRMRKEDVEEVFDMVPLLTKVTIGRNNLPPIPSQQDPSESKLPAFKLPPQAKEENSRKVYKWLN
ncbi:L,D-transpeptidase [Paenibacillus sp. KN14-4R]|uniref:L,D-transpeptidase n=1 Tax=Paenibacillus sp. KN14-4R TaxID=3445773 RepID=UPI003FA0F4B4